MTTLIKNYDPNKILFLLKRNIWKLLDIEFNGCSWTQMFIFVVSKSGLKGRIFSVRGVGKRKGLWQQQNNYLELQNPVKPHLIFNRHLG